MLPKTWRYKRFHVSYLLTWCSVGLLVGLLLGSRVSVSAVWLVVVLALGVVIVSLKSRRWYACILIVAMGMVLGMLRGSLFDQALGVLKSSVGQEVSMTGRIVQDPTLRNGSNLWQAEIDSLRIDDAAFTGTIYVTTVSDETLKRGDVVTVTGRLLYGFGSFQASMYRAELVHVERPDDAFLAARDSFAEAVRRVMPEPEASLGLGFVVGQKSALPDDLTEQLKIVGLTHIVVASGYNLTILVRFARRLLARRSRYLALAGSLALVVGFVFVSGFSASMNRAAIVTILSLLAWYYGRKFHPIQLILYVAAASAFVYPVYVWGDLGWLLSFAAFAGILVVAPIMTRLLYIKGREPGALSQLVIETLSAELMTLPILIVSFGYIPVLALVANVLVAPVIPFAMLFTFIAGVIGWVVPALSILALPASILVAYVVALVEWLSTPEWARFSLTVSGVFAWVWYGILAAVCWYVLQRRKVDLRASSVVE